LLREHVIELVQAEPYSPIHVRAAASAAESGDAAEFADAPESNDEPEESDEGAPGAS
jgi:chromatin segregation and condensation protein Rec8/ScpA/Scc1 (kleisin family)